MKPRQMAGFFYTVDFGKLNQLFLVRIELAEFTWTLSEVEVHIELAEFTSSLPSAHRACRVQKNSRFKNYHIFK